MVGEDKRAGIKTYLVLAVNGVATAATAVATPTLAIIIAPAGTLLSIRTIAGHVSSVTADTADNAGRVVGLVRAIVLAMTNATAVLACLVLVITECTVKSSKLT